MESVVITWCRNYHFFSVLFRDLSSVLPLNQHHIFAVQISGDVTDLPPLSLFDSFQSRGIFAIFKQLIMSKVYCIGCTFLVVLLNWCVALIIPSVIFTIYLNFLHLLCWFFVCFMLGEISASRPHDGWKNHSSRPLEWMDEAVYV